MSDHGRRDPGGKEAVSTDGSRRVGADEGDRCVGQRHSENRAAMAARSTGFDRQE